MIIHYLRNVIFLCFIISFETTYSQTITSAIPTSAVPGQTIDIIIRGSGTHFQQGVTLLDFGQNIVAPQSRIQVQNSTLIYASITVSASCPAGVVDIKAITRNEVAISSGGFQVFAASGVFRTSLEVLPVQTLSLGDIDPSNLTSAPCYFWVNIYNNAVKRTVKIDLTLSSQKYGLLGTTTDPTQAITPNQYLRLDKTAFTKYSNTPGAKTFYNQVLATGAFPADNYTYSVKVTDLATGEISSDSNITTINNSINNPQLILPGAGFSDPEQTISLYQPLFQWFGQNDKYDFSLYMINKGQTAEEAIRNIPVYKTSGIQTNSFLYPNSAEKLIDGQEYVWQITANITGIKGNQTLPSEPFRFMYKSILNAGLSSNAASIKISPQQVTLTQGQQFKFTATVFDNNNVPLMNIPVSWSISTDGKATVDSNGMVIVNGGQSGTFAVIAKVGNSSDYATINVSGFSNITNLSPFGSGGILKQLFGLPK